MTLRLEVLVGVVVVAVLVLVTTVQVASQKQCEDLYCIRADLNFCVALYPYFCTNYDNYVLEAQDSQIEATFNGDVNTTHSFLWQHAVAPSFWPDTPSCRNFYAAFLCVAFYSSSCLDGALYMPCWDGCINGYTVDCGVSQANATDLCNTFQSGNPYGFASPNTNNCYSFNTTHYGK